MLNLPNIYLKDEHETDMVGKNGTCILFPLYICQKCYSVLDM